MRRKAIGQLPLRLRSESHGVRERHPRRLLGHRFGNLAPAVADIRDHRARAAVQIALPRRVVEIDPLAVVDARIRMPRPAVEDIGVGHDPVNRYEILETTASAISAVVAVPPISGVRTRLSPVTSLSAHMIACAASRSPRKSSIIEPAQMAA